MAAMKSRKEPINQQRSDPADWHPSRADQFKALCDYLKHIATLSAGSILLIATMLEKMFAQPHGRSWIACAMVAFLSSLIASAIGFLVTAVVLPRAGRRKPSQLELNFSRARSS